MIFSKAPFGCAENRQRELSVQIWTLDSFIFLFFSSKQALRSVTMDHYPLNNQIPPQT